MYDIENAFEELYSEFEEGLMDGPHFAGSRHKKIERDKYNKKRKGRGIADELEKEASTYRDRSRDEKKKKKRHFAFGGKKDNMRAGGSGYGKGEEVEEAEIDEAKSKYEKEIAAFLAKGGTIKKLAVDKKAVAAAAAQFKKKFKIMTQKEIELDIEDEIEARANAEGVVGESMDVYLFGKKLGDYAKKSGGIDKDDLMFIAKEAEKGNMPKEKSITKMDTAPREVVLDFMAKEFGRKFIEKEYKTKFTNPKNYKEGVVVEGKILKPGTKVKVAHPAKGKGMVTGKIVRYDDQGPGSPFYVIDIGERMSEKVPAHKIKEETMTDEELHQMTVDLANESLELQMKMAFDDAGIKMKAKDGKIVVAKKDEKKAKDILTKSLPKKLKAFVDKGMDQFFIFEEAEKIVVTDEIIKEMEEIINEVLKSKDKSVIDAFYDKKPLEGRLLTTDGMVLDKIGMGKQQIAQWNKGKIKITAVSDVKSTEQILKYMRASIPSGVFEDRDYRKEYDNYQGKPEQIARRSSRNQARRVMGDKTEEGKDVGHKDNNPMNNDPKNLRNEDPSKNRREPRLRKVESFKDFFNKPGIEIVERKLTDTEVKRREEIAQELEDDEFKKRYGDDWKSVKMGVATNMAKKESFESVQYVFERYKYDINHKTYSSAVEEALLVADKAGYEVDMDDYFNKIATGPRKPSEGKTNIFQIALEKGGKEQRKKLQIQIYGKGKHGFELNCYIQ